MLYIKFAALKDKPTFSSLTVYFVMYRYTISCRICVVATRQLIKYLTLV